MKNIHKLVVLSLMVLFSTAVFAFNGRQTAVNDDSTKSVHKSAKEDARVKGVSAKLMKELKEMIENNALAEAGEGLIEVKSNAELLAEMVEANAAAEAESGLIQAPAASVQNAGLLQMIEANASAEADSQIAE